MASVKIEYKFIQPGNLSSLGNLNNSNYLELYRHQPRSSESAISAVTDAVRVLSRPRTRPATNASNPKMAPLPPPELNTAISDFLLFLQIPSISGSGPLDGSYDACGQFLLDKMKELGMQAKILEESVEHKPVVVGTVVGSDVSFD